jgi:hypothetical protein
MAQGVSKFQPMEQAQGTSQVMDKAELQVFLQPPVHTKQVALLVQLELLQDCLVLVVPVVLVVPADQEWDQLHPE